MITMKKFLLKVTAYLLILSTITVGINVGYQKLDRRRDSYRARFQSMPEQIQICNFGSSHGQDAFLYRILGQKYSCFNFGASSQKLSYDERLMDYYQDHIQEGGVVFVDVSYFSFFGKPEVERDDFDSKNKRYYYVLDKAHIKNYSAKVNFLLNVMPALDAGSDLLKVYLRKEIVPEETDESCRTTNAEEAAEHGKRRISYHGLADQKDSLDINREEVDALYSILRRCKQKNWKPILISTPLLPEYWKEAQSQGSEHLKVFYSIVNQAAIGMNIPYYDYSTDERFANRYDLFMNTDHLNRYGADEFEKILCKEVLPDFLREESFDTIS